MTLKTTLLCTTLIGAALPALAEEKRALDAHEHGHGALNIAVDGNTIALELDVPGFDIVGFEHAATTDADKATLQKGMAQLKDPLSLFALPTAAGCEVTSVEVALHGGDEHEEHDDHDHDDHAKTDGHDDHDHDDHAHENEDHDSHEHDAHADEDAHSEFHAHYSLSCADASKVSAITLAYFNVFPNAEELEVQVVTEAGARAVEASRDAPDVELN
ncbi:zinc uptake protein ZrgA [Shimia marina]|uniref:ABC-type Zn2+ transport system, periplasmic component/surface adhesin n=1 Tax=Shimia marina TaxID=321267 RepID=A0A0P1EKP2_9RHOB|nr:DUF2796 domain-containing protein [Shimia marina]CUH50711.1 hypothetical protein SHM7688_00139 [Shimia marina]SFE36177.1 Protein of unknown function [Shimia marina]